MGYLPYQLVQDFFHQPYADGSRRIGANYTTFCNSTAFFPWINSMNFQGSPRSSITQMVLARKTRLKVCWLHSAKTRTWQFPDFPPWRYFWSILTPEELEQASHVSWTSRGLPTTSRWMIKGPSSHLSFFFFKLSCHRVIPELSVPSMSLSGWSVLKGPSDFLSYPWVCRFLWCWNFEKETNI